MYFDFLVCCVPLLPFVVMEVVRPTNCTWTIVTRFSGRWPCAGLLFGPCSWCAVAMDMDDSDQEEMEEDWEKDADSQDELLAEQAGELRRLGFHPQKRLATLRHLPYGDGLDREAADNLAKIKLNLAAAVTANDRRGFQVYTRRLEM